MSEKSDYEEGPKFWFWFALLAALFIIPALIGASAARHRRPDYATKMIELMADGRVYKVQHRPDGVWDIRSTNEQFVAAPSCSTVLTR